MEQADRVCGCLIRRWAKDFRSSSRAPGSEGLHLSQIWLTTQWRHPAPNTLGWLKCRVRLPEALHCAPEWSCLLRWAWSVGQDWCRRLQCGSS